MLGLGSNLSKVGLSTPGIVTDNLVLKHKYDAEGVVPVSDGAAYFDGVNDYIRIKDDSTFHHDNGSASLISVGCWIKISGSTSDDDTFISKYDYHADQTAREWRLSVNGSQVPKIAVSNNGTTAIISTATNALDANWNHFMFTYDGSQGTAADRPSIYINGVKETLTQSGTPPAQIHEDDADIIIGGMLSNDSLSGPPNDTYICNAGVWNTVLTQAQIKSIMWKNYAGLTDSEKTNLVSWWNLDTLIDDASTSQYQSTTIGAVYDNHNSALGENLFDNETFDNTDAVYSTTAATYDISGPGITINGTGTGETSTNQKIDLGSFSVTAGDLYLISFDITARNDVTNSGIIVNNTSLKRNLDHFDEDADHYWYPAVIGTHETICIPHSSSFSLQLHIGTNPGGTASFDNVKVRKLGGNPGELT